MPSATAVLKDDSVDMRGSTVGLTAWPGPAPMVRGVSRQEPVASMANRH